VTVNTVIGDATPVAYDPGQDISHVAVLALDDGTFLIAWTGVLQHRSRDLTTVLGATPVPGRVFILVDTPAGPALLDEEGSSWAVTTDPLTATPGPAGPVGTGSAAGGWHAAAGSSTIVAIDYQDRLSTYPGGTDLPIPSSWVAGVWPNDASTVYASTGTWSGGRSVHTVSPGGSWALHTIGPDIPGGDYSYPLAGAIPNGDDWLWPSVENTSTTGYAETFVLRDTAGNVTHTDPWPSVEAPAALFSIGGASPLPNRQGAVLAGLGRTLGAGGASSAAAFIIRDGTVTRVDLPLPRADLVMNFTQSEAMIVHVSPDGRTAIIAVQAQVEGSPDMRGLTAWTIDLGGHDGILDIFTLDQDWWTDAG